MSMNRKQFISAMSLRNRIISVMLSILMLASMLPFGAIINVSAENNNPSFIFTDKNGTGISGVTITLTSADGKEIISEPSDNNGIANFIKDIPAIGSSYDYTVNNTGSYIAEPGNITINDNSPIEIILYAPAPTGRIKPVNQSSDVNGKITFSIVIDNEENAGDLSYQWYKGNNAIAGETDAQLSIPIAPSEAKDYYCEVTSALSKDGVKAVFKASDAVPDISFKLEPKNSDGNQITVSVAVTVSLNNPDDVENPFPVSVGMVQFIVHNKSTGLTNKFDSYLNSSGQAVLDILLSKQDIYTIQAVYSDNSGQYASIAAPSYVYNYDGSAYYTITTPSNPNGWYKAGEQLEIYPANEFDSIRVKVGDGPYENWATEFKKSNETTAEGENITFYLSNPQGQLTNEITINYKKDGTIPDSVTIAQNWNGDEWERKPIRDHFIFGHNKNNYLYQVTLSANDTLSGVEYFQWRYKGSKEWSDPVYATPDFTSEGLSTAQIGVNYDQWYKNNGIEVIAYDYAGNASKKASVNAQQSITVEYNTDNLQSYIHKNNEEIFPDKVWINDNDDENISKDEIDSITNLIYNKATSVTITIPKTLYDEHIENIDTKYTIQISLNHVVQLGLKWTQDEENSTYSTTIALKEGDSEVRIIAPKEYDIISNEIGNKIVKSKYTSKIHTVDTTKPIINTEIGEIRDDGSRDITVIIKDKNFQANDLYFSNISVTDIQGNPIEEFNADVFLNELRNAKWELIDTDYDEDTDKNEYAATVTLSINANYSFILKCKDLANNIAESSDITFAIDNIAPEDLQISYITKPVNIFLQIISLGFYNPDVTVQLSAKDDISGVESFNWTYTRQDNKDEYVSESNKEKESGTINSESENFSYKDNMKTAVASFTLTGSEIAQYRGSISFTATDKADNTSNIHNGHGTATDADGNEHNTNPNDNNSDYVFVVDTIAPTRTVTYPIPQIIRDKDTLEPITESISGNNEDYMPDEGNYQNSILYYNKESDDIIPITLKITEANFYADDVNVTIIYNDQDDNPIDYKINDWSQNGDEYTGIINLKDDGKYKINVYYKDKSGNEMQEYISPEIVIDRKNPNIIDYTFEVASSDGLTEATDFIEILEYGYYFKEAFELKVHTSDFSPSSGFDKVFYRLVPYNDGNKSDDITGPLFINDITEDKDNHTLSCEASFNIPAGFKGQIYIESYDNAGNKSDEVTPQAFVFDDIKPTIDVINNSTTQYTDSIGNPLYIEDTSITVTITDIKSGIRNIGYTQTSENNTFERKEINIENTGYKVGDDVGDGWIISEMDVNLVTKVTKTFYYNSDDNDIMLTLDATDRSGNKIEGITSNKFTIDKTAPIINVVFREDDDTDLYYDANRIADITVIERNFDASRINAIIENTFGDIPSFTFTDVSNTEHIAVIDFDEGDYTFEMNGTDLGDHTAIVNYSGGNENLFYVDKTKPVISDNFIEFSNNATEDSFNIDKTATISVTEHNFDPNLMNLRILRKDAGADHNNSGLVDVTAELIGGINWSSNGDVHNISFTISQDAVYQIEMTPADLAGNTADYRSTVVFEIDKTAPVISARNGQYVSEDDIEFIDVYTYDRKDEAAPTVEFMDYNIDHIKYALTVWIPDYSNPDSLPTVKPKTVYLDEDPNKTGIISGGKFTLPDFIKDGVYTVELIAVDVAGNESTLNTNTYARMIEQDVLAFILNSNVENKTGLYSFQYEDGTPISMRPDNFSDLEIFVLARKNTNVDIVLRDTNAQEISANPEVTTDDSIYGFTIYYYLLKSDFFKDNFSDDMDADLHLTVKNDDKRIDLGKIHIDNMAPTYELPNDFNSWHWYFGDETRTITISNINELLDQNNCKVYDNDKEIDFNYSSETNTISFALSKGWHNVGVILNDTAGNENNISERIYMHVGYFWLWMIIIASVLIIFSVSFVLIHNRNKKRKLENE